MIPKSKIAASFSQAAASYDGSAQFQRDVGLDLMNTMPHDLVSAVLDLGSGTGALHGHLLQRFKPQLSAGMDLAHGMNQFARSQLDCSCNSLWVTADAELMPFADNQFDLVYANLSLQWCWDIERLAAELMRILKPGGSLWYSTLLPGTLKELEASWAQVDHYPHVNQFPAEASVVTSWQIAGFQVIGRNHKPYQLRYQAPIDLLQELKGIGAHFMDTDANPRVTSPGTLRRMLEAYQQFKTADGCYPATYEVLMLGLQKT